MKICCCKVATIDCTRNIYYSKILHYIIIQLTLHWDVSVTDYIKYYAYMYLCYLLTRVKTLRLMQVVNKLLQVGSEQDAAILCGPLAAMLSTILFTLVRTMLLTPDERIIKGSPSIDLARGPTPYLDHSNGKPYTQ